jgi:iron complex transport system ATP-binding protein
MALKEKHIVLEANNVSVGYLSKKKSTVVSEKIDFSISKGELIGIVGANGIGKSTLLRTLAGMQPLLHGEVLLNAKNLDHYSSLQLANLLSVVLTESPASKNLTVLELVSLGRQPHTNWMGSLSEADTRAINFSLDVTSTASLAQSKCYELSDGQLQRVYIARALAQDTPIIVLDEPTTHLDVFHRAQVLKLLKKLTKETQKTILFSTHEIELAIQMCDQLLVMTPKESHFNTPENLIKAGTFHELFPSEVVHFDSKTGRFIVNE